MQITFREYQKEDFQALENVIRKNGIMMICAVPKLHRS